MCICISVSNIERSAAPDLILEHLKKMPSDHPKSALLLQRINTSSTPSPSPITSASCSRPRPASSAATGFDWRTTTSTLSYGGSDVPDSVARYHTHWLGPNQCCSSAMQEISAPTETVWSIVRRFDKPQTYKQFIKSCYVIVGDGNKVGTLRKVDVVSGLPATYSIEHLDILDEERHVSGFSIIGGDHRLVNYRSVTTLHQSPAADGHGRRRTVVVESYVVDIPAGNTWDETCVFVGTIVNCNLKWLKSLAEDLAARNASIIQYHI